MFISGFFWKKLQYTDCVWGKTLSLSTFRFFKEYWAIFFIWVGDGDVEEAMFDFKVYKLKFSFDFEFVAYVMEENRKKICDL